MLDVLAHCARGVAIVLTIGVVGVCAQEPAPQSSPADPQQGDPQPQPPLPAGVGSAASPATGKTDAGAAASANVEAGGTTSRPFSGIFGGAMPADPTRDAFDLSGSAFATHMTDSQPYFGSSQRAASGYDTFNYGGGGAAVHYNHNWEHAVVGFDGSDSSAYFSPTPTQDGGWINQWIVGGDAAFNSDQTRRFRVNAAVREAYSPYYRQGLLEPGNIPSLGWISVSSPGFDTVVTHSPSLDSQIGGGVAYSLTRRSSLEFSYNLRRVDFVTSTGNSYYDQLAEGRYRYQVNQYLGLHAGYGYRTTAFGEEEETAPVREHLLDVGADAGKGFQLTRQTTFSFSLGSSVLVTQNANRAALPSSTSDTASRLYFNGSADLTRRWARSWSASLGASQNVQYEPGFQQPLLNDELYVGLGGLATRKFDLSARAAYNFGTVGFATSNNGYSTWSASGLARYALNKRLAAYAQYFYYRYLFDNGITLPSYLGHSLNRYGASVGLTTWIPLLKDGAHR
jgi:hypothetical protein